MNYRSRTCVIIGLLAVGPSFSQTPKAVERTIHVEQFGFIGGTCDYRQSVQFLDDDRLILSAPLAGSCNKGNWSTPLETQLTVIDLSGSVHATKRRPVYWMQAGPMGYAAVCAEGSLELVSADLDTKFTIPSRASQVSPCADIDGLSPSRSAISVRDFGDAPKSPARHRLIDPALEKPLAERQFVKGEILAGISDSGYAICTSESHQTCQHLVVDGRAWKVSPPERASLPGLFLSPTEMLYKPRWTEREVMNLRPDGSQEQVFDTKRLQPPNVDNIKLQISTTLPRRMLYSATGCYIGDFDDCYALIFGRIVVFDPQTHKAVFQQKVAENASSILSPNGHVVVVLDKSKLHIYMIP